MPTKYLPLGSISSATHRPQDLVPAFLSALEGVDPREAESVRQKYPLFTGHSAGERIDFEENEEGHERFSIFVRQLVDDGCNFAHVRISPTYPLPDSMAVLVMTEMDDPDDDDEAWDKYAGETSELINEVLFNALNEHVPPFCYFSAHEGDGADFGVWFSNEQMDEALRAKEAVKVNDGVQWRFATLASGWAFQTKSDDGWTTQDTFASRPDYVVEVNDHGNVVLLSSGGVEIYSLV